MIKRESRDRYKFLEVWARGVREVIAKAYGKVDRNGEAIITNVLSKSYHIQAINGPRVAGLRLNLGPWASEVVSILERNGMALLRQSVPTEAECPDATVVEVDPITGWYGRLYTIYVPWSARLAESDIQTQTLLREKTWIELEEKGDFWIAGLEEHYEPLRMSLDIKQGSPHYFFLGTTQSGKSTALQNAVAQLALCKDNRFIFIDAEKKGDGLGILPALRQCIGPPAYTVDEARDVLIWLLEEKDSRYNGGPRDTRLIVIIDELPGLSQDKICVNAVEKIASAGAQCQISLLCAAQHAIEKALGPFAGILKANVSGRQIFHTSSLAGSVEGMHDNRALTLQTPGDCWAFNANIPPTRIQASYFPTRILQGKKKWFFGPPIMENWPKVVKESYDSGNGNGFSEDLIAKAVAFRLEGRLKGETRGYGRTVAQERFGLIQNQSVQLLKVADGILDAIWKVGRGK